MTEEGLALYNEAIKASEDLRLKLGKILLILILNKIYR